MSVSALAKWNGMAPSQPLSVGKTLVIWTPDDGSRNVTRKIVYRVKAGDNLSTIARRYDVGTSELKRWNANKLGKYLQPGQALTINIALASSN